MEKDLFFKPYLPEGEVEIPGLGTVRVRALTHNEAEQIGSVSGAAAKVRKQLSLGMVDPVMSEEDIRRWQEARPAGELERVGHKIAELSDMLPDSAKGTYKSV